MRTRIALMLVAMLTLMLAWHPVYAGNAALPLPVRADGTVGAAGGSGGSYGGNPGTWYVGATPPNADPTKPVLVFVHGKAGWAGQWWLETEYHGVNDMYAFAYNNGYRTAYVDLVPNATMWENGALLRRQLDQITAHFGVERVTVIAHSKGGVDANAASVFYGAGPKIQRVITLGTPHWGTPVADLAYSNWAAWIAELLGERTEGTYVMQTGYMRYFRSIADGQDPALPYHTVAGYRCGPAFTALWLGCIAIAGEDDGLVPVWSARKPGASHLAQGRWDHDEIRMGSRTWSTIAPVLQGASTAGSAAAVTGSGPEPPGNLILRGGTTAGEAPPAFPLESGVRSVTFTLLSSSQRLTGKLIGPDGEVDTVGMSRQVQASEPFGGAWMGTVKVTAPDPGLWRLQTSASEEAGYLLVAAVESDLRAAVQLGQKVATPGQKQRVAIGFGAGRRPVASQASAALNLNGGKPFATSLLSATGQGHAADLLLPRTAGVYNATITVTGRLSDGTTFERTVVTSFAAVPPGQTGIWR